MIFFESTRGELVIVAEEFTTPDVEEVILAQATERARPGLRDGFRRAHEEEDRLLAGASAQQRAIARGDYATTHAEGPGFEGLLIYGRIMTTKEIIRREREAGGDEDEIRDLLARLAWGYKRGWRYGMWYSVAVVEGELGAHHVGRLTLVSESDFEDARARGWSV